MSETVLPTANERKAPHKCVELSINITYFAGKCKDRHADTTVRWIVAGIKKPRLFNRGFVLALPIFAASHPATIVGANELNFCVRDGNRWTLIAINTNSYG